jgi:CrcB protein
MNNLITVFVSGGLGCLARYGVNLATRKLIVLAFPLATLISNTLSCLIVALAFGMFSEKVLAQPTLRLMVVTGFCGGFSTFSAFSLETVQMMRDGHAALAMLNVVLSLLIGFGLIFYLSKNV